MLWFFVFLIIPLIWIVVAKIHFHTFTWKEAGIQLGFSLVLCIALAALTVSSRYVGTMDTEIHNGVVTNKHSDRVSCTHSYQCNCRTDSDGNRKCQTCYEHSYDIDWIVETSVGDMDIDRVNRQGTIEPPRFSKVQVGEPAAVENSYTNYIKAVPESVFNTSDFEQGKVDVSYPSVYDYYRVEHVINNGSGVSNDTLDAISHELKHELISLGDTKQVNLLLIFVDGDTPRTYADKLEYSWLGGKKNDVVTVMSVDDNTIKWTKSFGWSKSTRVFHELEHQLSGKEVNVDLVDTISSIVVEYYERQPFEEYRYLMNEVKPPLWAIILFFLVNIAFTGFIGYRFVTNDTK